MSSLTSKELQRFLARAPSKILKNPGRQIDLIYPRGKEIDGAQTALLESWAKGMKSIGLISRFMVCCDALVIIKEAA